MPQAPARSDVIVGPFTLPTPSPIDYGDMWRVFQGFLAKHAPAVNRVVQGAIDEENRTTSRYDTAAGHIVRDLEAARREVVRQRFLDAVRHNPGGPVTITGGQ